MLSEHYKKLVHKFTNNCRKDEDEDREEMFEDIKWETVKEMRPCLKNDILRSFTPRSAIDYLPADLNRKPNDESDLLQQINMYLSKYTTLERFQRGSNTLCAVHRLMRKTGFCGMAQFINYIVVLADAMLLLPFCVQYAIITSPKCERRAPYAIHLNE